MSVKHRTSAQWITISEAARILGLRDFELHALIRRREVRARRFRTAGAAHSESTSGSWQTLVDINSVIDFDARRRAARTAARPQTPYPGIAE